MEGAILITGAARRIGRAIALGLAADGYAVGVHYHRSAADAQALVGEIESRGGTAVAIAADLTDEAETAGLVERAAGSLAPLTGLINNASVFIKDEALSVSKESWDRHMQVNLRAPFVLIQSFASQLSEDAAGNVINIIDHRVWKLNPLFTSYTLSKSGLWTLTRTLAQALAPRIRVNAIGPGPVLPSRYQDEDEFAHEAAAVPLGRGPRAEEIAEAVRFLLSARSITGQMLALDGGQHLAWKTPDLAPNQGD